MVQQMVTSMDRFLDPTVINIFVELLVIKCIYDSNCYNQFSDMDFGDLIVSLLPFLIPP
jgi:hypothetical protein